MILTASMPLVIRQEADAQNERKQENKERQIFRKTSLTYPLIRTCTCAYWGVRNASFTEDLASFVLLLPTF